MIATAKAASLIEARKTDTRAAVTYRGKSAKERHALRRKITPESIFNGGMRSNFDLSKWPMTAHVERINHNRFDVIVTGGYRTLRLPCKYFRGYRGLLGCVSYEDFNSPVLADIAEAVGFDKRLSTLWLFEIEGWAGADPLLRALLGAIKQSICDLHLLEDGSVIRVYSLDGDVVVEIKRPNENHVEMNGIEYFLRQQGISWEEE